MARQRESRMIFSSDFLTLAKAKSVEKTVTIPASEFENVSFDQNIRKAAYYHTAKVKMPQPKGSIELIEVAYDGVNGETSNYQLCNGFIKIIEGFDYGTTWYIYWERDNEYIYINTTAYQDRYSVDWPSNIAPSLVLRFRASYFYPPNIS